MMYLRLHACKFVYFMELCLYDLCRFCRPLTVYMRYLLIKKQNMFSNSVSNYFRMCNYNCN